jgi:hypothetical protein
MLEYSSGFTKYTTNKIFKKYLGSKCKSLNGMKLYGCLILYLAFTMIVCKFFFISKCWDSALGHGCLLFIPVVYTIKHLFAFSFVSWPVTE